MGGGGYSCAHGAQINFGDPTLYLTNGKKLLSYIYIILHVQF
jgi:hypothetical protein